MFLIMKSGWYIFTWVAVIAFLTVGCFRQDVRTLVVSVPQMKTDDCVKIIQGALSRIDGIVSVHPDIEKRTLSITYNSTKLAIKNIEFLIAGVGFDANDVPGKPDAKASLPAGCR